VDTSNFKLFPNPKNGKITIQASTRIESIEVIDFNGNNLISVNNSLSKHHFDLTSLDSGIYLIEVKIDCKVLTKKLIIY